MRMWNVDPKLLCRKHLLGEHVEMHMFIGTLEIGNRMDGYVNGGLVEIHNIRKRHDELAAEMTRRGMKHQSPITSKVELYEAGKVDAATNLVELARRCSECEVLQNGIQLVA